MATIIDEFTSNLTTTLDVISESVIYADINEMYDDGRLQKDQLDKVVIAFHEKALSMAGSTSENIALKGYRLDEIIAKDIELKTAQIAESTGKLAIAVEQSAKDLLVKDAQIAQSSKDIELKTAQIAESTGKLAIAVEQSAKDLLVKDAQIVQSSKDIELKTAQIAESTGKLAIAVEQSAKDLLVKAAQIITDEKRALLITRQERGFADNVVIERVKTTSESIGMIQSGGNEAPIEFFDEWTDAINDLGEVAKTHPDVT